MISLNKKNQISLSDYLADTTIDVSTDLYEESSYLRCADIGTIDASGPNMTVICTEPRKGKFVRLTRKQGANTASELVVCEVEVRGYLYRGKCAQYYNNVGIFVFPIAHLAHVLSPIDLPI